MNGADEIARELGLRRSGRVWSGDCPCCGYPGAFTVGDRGGRTLVRCHAGCDQEEVLAALCSGGLWGGHPAGFPERAAATGEVTAAALAVWRRTVPIAGTPAEAYLRSRGIDRAPPTLRFHPALRHVPSGLALPALVAAVTVWPDRRPCAVHRTWLRPDGSGKAAVDPPRMTLGPVRGGAVRLEPAGRQLGVGEGIESSASIRPQFDVPAWAALSAGGLRTLVLPPLPLASEVLIGADHDPPGLKAAEAAAGIWTAEGRVVKIMRPDWPGHDWNDVLRGAGRA